MKKHILLLIVGLFSLNTFSKNVGDTLHATTNGITIAYKITSLSPFTVQVGSDLSIGGFTIAAIDIRTSGILNIPPAVSDGVNTYSVTAIGNCAFTSCIYLTSVTIPSSVTSIGNQAFSGCISLTSINLPYSLTSIGYYAFSGCSNLGKIISRKITPPTLGANVFSSIPSTAKTYCPTSAVSDYFSNGYPNPQGVLAGKSVIDLCAAGTLSSQTYIDNDTLVVTGSANKIDFDTMVTWINSNSLKVIDLTRLTIESVNTKDRFYPSNELPMFAFHMCSRLTSIYLPSEIVSIGAFAFSICTDLSSISFSNTSSLKSIGEGAFSGIIVKDLIIPDGVTTIGKYSFEGCTMTSISIPNSVESIGEQAFHGCLGLTSISIPSSVKRIDKYAFWDCSELTAIDLSNLKLTCIDTLFFRDCVGLKSVKIPNSVTSIKYGAFYGCTGLTNIILPNRLESIDDESFNNCEKLDSINCLNQSKPATLGVNVFSGISSTAKTYCPTGTSKLYSKAGYPKPVSKKGKVKISITSGTLSTISYSPGDSLEITGTMNYSDLVLLKSWIKDSSLAVIDLSGVKIEASTVDSKTYNANEIPASLFSGCTGLTSFTLPSTLTSIGTYAFSGCKGLASIEFPETLTSIGNSAFANCTKLDSIEIPSSVKSIGNKTFYGCTGLTSVTISDSLTTIGTAAFSGCKKLKTIEVSKATKSVRKAYISRINLEVTALPKLLTSIGDSAFYDCSALTSITIPSLLTSIGSYAFASCTSLDTIFSNSGTPASLGTEVFKGVSTSTCVLIVSTNKSKYAAADQWKDFTKIVELNTTAIENYSETNSIKIYPNPATDNITVVVADETDLTLTNQIGQVVLTDIVSGTKTIDVSSLPRGLYFIKVGKETQKIVLK